jgi:hypothetical protein
MSLLRVGISIALLRLSSFQAPAATTNTYPPLSQERTVAFAWNSPRDSSVVSYKIYWGTGRGNYQHMREIVTHTAKLRLATNTTYYVAVSACNTVGESRLSNEVRVPAAADQGGW